MKKIFALIGIIALTALCLWAGSGEVSGPETSYGGTPGYRVWRANGHTQGKERVLSGDVINGLNGYGYNGSAFTTSSGVNIYLKANQSWTTTANGTKITFETTPDDSATAAEVMSIDDNGNVAISGNLSVTGTTGGTGSSSVSTITVTNEILLGATTAISTFTPTAITLDDGLTLTVNGSETAEDIVVDDLNAHETLYMGETTAISTFTPTALTLDDGLTLTANGPATFAGITLLQSNAAPRTNITPGRAGAIIWNSADAELCVSTGTAATSWVLAADGATACSH